MTLKHYVRWWYPGAFVSESSTAQITDRDHIPEPPAAAYAYDLFDREEVQSEHTGELLRGKPKDVSGMHYIDGDLYDVARVRLEAPDKRTLLTNMEVNGWSQVVRTPQGFLPFQDGDQVVHRVDLRTATDAPEGRADS